MITCYESKRLYLLSQYKNVFFVAKTQIEHELIKPLGISSAVKKAITLIEEDRDEILIKTIEFGERYRSLSYYDCLCMSYAFLDDYCLVTDDKILRKKCELQGIETISSEDILNKLLKEAER